MNPVGAGAFVPVAGVTAPVSRICVLVELIEVEEALFAPVSMLAGAVAGVPPVRNIRIAATTMMITAAIAIQMLREVLFIEIIVNPRDILPIIHFCGNSQDVGRPGTFQGKLGFSGLI